MNSKHDLRLDWCSHEAAKYAVEHWHYSGCLPAGKLVKVGVWETRKFIGAVLFSRGANRDLLSPYGLNQCNGCELTRVALSHHESSVSRIVAIALRLLRGQSEGLRLVVSFADTARGHNGGIYQAGNWIYSGAIKLASTAEYHGRIAHRRTFDRAGVKGYKLLPAITKHRYLMPLDAEMREQIMPLSQPYPKRDKQAMTEIHSAQRRGSTDRHAPIL